MHRLFLKLLIQLRDLILNILFTYLIIEHFSRSIVLQIKKKNNNVYTGDFIVLVIFRCTCICIFSLYVNCTITRVVLKEERYLIIELDLVNCVDGNGTAAQTIPI